MLFKGHTRKELWLLLVVGCMIFVIGMILFLKSEFKQLHEDFKEFLPSSFELSKADSELISVQFGSRFKVEEVFKSSKREAVSLIVADSLYYLVFTKLPLKREARINNIVQIKHFNQGPAVRQTYRDIKVDPSLTIQVKSGKIDSVTMVNLASEGKIESLAQTGNDSLTYFDLTDENLSLSYDKESTPDILIHRRFEGRRSDRIHGSIMFLKREAVVNVFILFAINSKDTVRSEYIWKNVFPK